MILFENVSKSYGEKELFHDLNFCVHSNEKCGFVGRNGSGKTTLFRLVTQNESADSGKISIPSNYTFGYLDQHIHFSQSSVLNEVMQVLQCEEWEKEYQTRALLSGLGFSNEAMNKNPHELSGGYQIRVQLAKVLLSDPSCLLLDEPTNYLDIVSVKWLKKFLKSWKGSYIIISHERDFLDSISSHTLGLHRGKIYKVAGPTRNFFELIVKKEEAHQAQVANLEKKRERLQQFIKRFGAKASKASQARSKKKALEKIPALEQLMAMHCLQFRFNEKPISSKKILAAESVCFRYDNMSEEDLIHDFSLSLEREEKIAVIGKNGYGKSTILKLLAKELLPISGYVELSEKVSVGYFGQTNINRLNPSHRVMDEISSANPLLNIAEVRRICGIMMFAKDDAKKKISVLSGGEKSRVLLGKILASPCNFLVLDEPTNHLDMESSEALLDALEEFTGSFVIVTHSEMILNRLKWNRLIVCHEHDQQVFYGDYKDFLQKIGWSDDFVLKKKKIDKKCINKEAKNKKKQDQERKEISKKIKQIENQITHLEKVLEKEENALIEASNRADKDKILKYSKQTLKYRKEIDELFEILDQFYKNYEFNKE